MAKQLLQHERNMDAGMGMRRRAHNPANSIEGGTPEVQLNIIAKCVLGLPD